MKYRAFGDESGTHKKDSPCYGIGCLVVPANMSDPIEEELRQTFDRRGLQGREMKWTSIRGHVASVDAAIEATDLLFESEVSFHAIVVRKDAYRNWRTDREEAFYKTYTMLATSIARQVEGSFELFLDDRSDRYAKRVEVVQLITNNFLAKLRQDHRISNAIKVDSKTRPLLQMADVWLGAVTGETNLWLGAPPLHAGKQRFCTHLASRLGWDRLWYDTRPNAGFNLWHFPIEFRAKPATRAVRPRLGWPTRELRVLR